MLFGCETQEERIKREKDEKVEEITKELTSKEIPKDVQNWIVSTTLDKVITVFCITTSKKCTEEKNIIEEIKTEYNVNMYYINVDEIPDESKNIYKTTYDIEDYTGYLPYMLVTDSKEVISTHTDMLKKEDFVNYLKELKIISS
jgi:alkyl hydroperoxide reductase subunit AhpC